MGAVAIVSFRLGLHDGVSVVAKAWQRSLHDLGWETYEVAGEGPVDHLIPGLAIGAADAERDQAQAEAELIQPLESALANADVVLVENLLSIPLNLAASRALAQVLAGRPAILHHHDPPWQRERFAHVTELPPDDPAWRHVTINRLTEAEMLERGVSAVTIYNGFDTSATPGRRDATRAALGLATEDDLGSKLNSSGPLVVHPVRAIERKNVPEALAITEALGGTYWLPGPAEEGYGPVLERVLDNARCPVLRTPLTSDLSVADLYAASDVVAFPSTWEGFGNPPIEAAIFRRPSVVGDYPVAIELRQLGMAWYAITEVERLAGALGEPQRTGSGPGGNASLTEALDLNQYLVDKELSLERMTERIADLLASLHLRGSSNNPRNEQ